MRFANPQAFYLLWLLPVIAVALHFFYEYRMSMMKRFMQEQFIDELAHGHSRLIYRLKAVFITAAFFFMVLALSRPQWGYTERPVKRHGLDIMVAIDVSKSMLTQDVAPNRLERTKLAIKDLILKLNGSDHIGLIAFAGDAMIMCPLTYDYNGFLLSLDDLSVNSVPRGGTDISAAIDEAINAYKGMTDADKALVLITDGEENEGDASQAALRAKKAGVRIFTVGVGTRSGELIMVPDDNGQMSYLKDANGDVVKSHLNENLLQQIAYITNGAYVHSGAGEFGLNYLYERQLSKLKKHDAEIKEARVYDERFQWPLTLAFILLLIEMVLMRVKRFSLLKKDCFAALAMTLIFLPSLSWASVAGDVNKGNDLYKQQKYDDSVGLYEKALDQGSNSAVVKYDLGTALYKKGDYDKALDYLQQAALDQKLKIKARYNLGNDLYKSGKAKEAKDIDGAIKNMKEAIGQYDGVLKDDPQDQDAQFNEDFVKKEIEHLKEQKRQQQQQQNQQNQNQKGKPQKQQNSQSQQGQQQKQDKQQENQQEQKSSQAKQDQQQQKQQEQASQAKEEQKQNQQSKHAAEKQEKKQSGSYDQSQVSQQQIDRKQAQDLLEDYEENEEPKKLLNYMPQKIDNRPVAKDW